MRDVEDELPSNLIYRRFVKLALLRRLKYPWKLEPAF
jgi:hypothetical protein